MSINIKTHPRTELDLICCRRSYVSLSLSNRITRSEPLLAKIFEWARDNAASFDVIIGDYFHRHNLEDLDGLSQAEALSEALADGDALAHRVQDVLDTLNIANVKIRLASDFSKTPFFTDCFKIFKELYESNAQFRQQIGIASEAFFQRFAPSRIHVEESRLHSRDYQLEELALFHLLADEGYSVNLYPGAHLPVMKEIVAGKLFGIIPRFHNLILVEIRFGGVK